jgi:DHA1 family arabinose polymer transporter-like MFS transporter
MIDKRVLPLAIGGLGIGTTEFAIMGLLPDISRSLDVSIPEAGHFISSYALGVVIGAPLLIGYTVKYPPKKVLVFLMIIFSLFNGLSMVASSYTSMLVIRFLSGLPHGAFFGVGTVVASLLAPKGREAVYISLMFAGLTVANLAMVPLVTYIGHHYGWPWYFGIVTVVGFLTIASIYLWLPDIRSQNQAKEGKGLQFLTSKETWVVLLITAIGFGGLFTWFSYINPLMTEVAGFSAENMAWIMILAGSGMVVGNLTGGLLADKFGAAKVAILLLSAMMLTLLFVFFFSAWKPFALVLTFICGALSMSVSPALNILMMRAAKGNEMMGAAFMQAAFNVANSAGAYLGGIPLIYGLSYNYPSLVGAFMTVIGILLSVLYYFRYSRAASAIG